MWRSTGCDRSSSEVVTSEGTIVITHAVMEKSRSGNRCAGMQKESDWEKIRRIGQHMIANNANQCNGSCCEMFVNGQVTQNRASARSICGGSIFEYITEEHTLSNIFGGFHYLKNSMNDKGLLTNRGWI